MQIRAALQNKTGNFQRFFNYTPCHIILGHIAKTSISKILIQQKSLLIISVSAALDHDEKIPT